MCTSHYSSPRGFTQAQCAIPSRVCGHPVPSSALLITGMFRAFYLTQTRPRASGPSQSFTTWNSSHIMHIFFKKRFKETRDEVRGVGRARGGYGNVITIGSAEILVGGRDGSRGRESQSIFFFSLVVNSLLMSTLCCLLNSFSLSKVVKNTGGASTPLAYQKLK